MDKEAMAIAQNREVSVADILEQWSRGEISTGLAIRRGRFDGFADLLDAALNSKIALRTELLPHEKAQSDRFVEMMISR